MQDQTEIINHAKAALSEEIGHSGNIGSDLLEHRFFSSLYELTPANTAESYVLKISTTERSCVDEYRQYQFISSLNIRSLKPITCSEEYNYLITLKMNLSDFTEFLNSGPSETEIESALTKFGTFLRSVENALPAEDKKEFSCREYLEYIEPRVQQLLSISEDKKVQILSTINTIQSKIDITKDRSTITSDLSLGNIHLNENREFVFVDMGDAEIGSFYDNIAFFYSELKFGGSQQYISSSKTTDSRFKAFLSGYEQMHLDDDFFNLFQIKRLVLMIHFTERLVGSTSSGKLRRLVSHCSNWLLVLRYRKNLDALLLK